MTSWLKLLNLGYNILHMTSFNSLPLALGLILFSFSLTSLIIVPFINLLYKFKLIRESRISNRLKKIPLFDKIKYTFKLFEDHVAWATWAFLLTVIGWLPAFFTGREFSNSVLYYSAPRITSTIFNLASLALITTIILSLCLLPKQ